MIDFIDRHVLKRHRHRASHLYQIINGQWESEALVKTLNSGHYSLPCTVALLASMEFSYFGRWGAIQRIKSTIFHPWLTTTLEAN